jgi:hypothetical protein
MREQTIGHGRADFSGRADFRITSAGRVLKKKRAGRVNEMQRKAETALTRATEPFFGKDGDEYAAVGSGMAYSPVPLISSVIKMYKAAIV